jgi:hypothetical protein
MANADSYLNCITGYYLENLPVPLLDFFVSQERIALEPEAMRVFSARLGIPATRRDFKSIAVLASLAARVQSCLDAVGGRAFVRLGSRSPKDSLCKRLPCCNTRDFFDMLFFSKRILDDVHWAFLHDYCVSVFVRPWLDIQRWQEFRCIIKGKKLYGISQYHSQDKQYFNEIYVEYTKIVSCIDVFVKNNILPHSIHDDYTCDILYQQGIVSIIDYNPLLRMTGLCLFEPHFQELKSPEFRFRLADGRIERVIL